MSKYPELEGVVRAYGVSYACAYMRLNIGWDLARAVNTPVRVSKPKPFKVISKPKPFKVISKPRRERFVQDRRVWNAKARAEKRAEDNSPLHIQRIRAAFCN